MLPSLGKDLSLFSSKSFMNFFHSLSDKGYLVRLSEEVMKVKGVNIEPSSFLEIYFSSGHNNS